MCAAQDDSGKDDNRPGAGDAETPGALFRAGRLDDAIAAANATVRRSPAVAGQRVLLAELLLFAGRFERADTVLAAAEVVDPALGLVISEFRHLLRAETARQQCWLEGRVPEFLGESTASLTASLTALAALRHGSEPEAVQAAAEAEATRPRIAGHHAGAAFDDLRDADDLHAGLLEVLTVTGRCFWVPTERVDEAVFHPPQRARDLFWRRCSMSIRGGPDGDVYLPAIYPPIAGSDAAVMPDTLRLGRSTDWTGDAVVRGQGQRLFLLGEAAVPIQDLSSLSFS